MRALTPPLSTSAGLRAAGCSFGATEGYSTASGREWRLTEIRRSSCPMLSGGLRRQGRMPRRKGAVRLFAAHQLTWVPLAAVLGVLLRARIPSWRGQEGRGVHTWRAAGGDGRLCCSLRRQGRGP